MSRCGNGTRKNKKNGRCEKTIYKKKGLEITKRCSHGTRKSKISGTCEKNYSNQKSEFFSPDLKKKFQDMYKNNEVMSKRTIDEWYKKHKEFMDISDDADFPDDLIFFTKLKTLVLSKSLVESYIIIIEDVDDQFEKMAYNECKGDMKKVSQYMLSKIATQLQRNYGRGFSHVKEDRELQFDVKLFVQTRNYRRKKNRQRMNPNPSI